jgi:hypothetical protein
LIWEEGRGEKFKRLLQLVKYAHFPPLGNRSYGTSSFTFPKCCLFSLTKGEGKKRMRGRGEKAR